jgi:uncharacterized protein (TIGR02266 family)
MDGNFSSWVAAFKQLDLKRSEGGLSPAEARDWLNLKDAIEHHTSSEKCPPSSQRESIRVPTDYEVTFEDPDGFRSAYLRNISEGGVYIESGSTFKMGDRFVLKMMMESPVVKIEQDVQVVWVNANPSTGSGLEPGVGVAFLNLPGDRKKQIKAIVHNRLDELVLEN